MLKRHLPLIVLIIVFLLLVQGYSWGLTPFEGPDEALHLTYVAHVRETGELPYPPRDFDTAMEQESGQPPLYYVTAAAFSLFRDLDGLDEEAAVNPWRGFGASYTSADNRNFFLMSTEGHALTHAQQDLIDAQSFLRLWSSVFGVLMIIGMYGAGLTLFKNQQWALLATLGVALNPQMLAMFGVVSNDVAVIAFGTFIMWAALRLYETPTDRRTLVLAGVAMGLAALSKAGGLALWVLPPAAIGLRWLGMGNDDTTHPTLRQTILAGLILVGVATLVGGWWYIRGWVFLDDPFGFASHERTQWGRDEPPPISEIIDMLPGIVVGVWARFGWLSVYARDWAYALPMVALLGGAVGWAKVRLDGRFIVLASVIVLGWVAFMRWAMVSSIVPGRLLLPYYPALVLMVVWGLRAFPQSKTWIAGAIGGVAVLVIPTSLIPAFHPPALGDSLPDDLNRVQLTYQNAIFEGFRVDQQVIQSGDVLDVTLCWRAPGSDNPIVMTDPFALHLIAPDGTIAARRESFTGMGSYTRWQPGKSFCDDFIFPIESDLAPGRLYPLNLSLFEIETNAKRTFQREDGQQGTDAVLAQLISPLGTRVSDEDINNAPFRFGHLALLDYQLLPGTDELTIAMAWGVAEPNPSGAPIKAFVHIVDGNGEIVAQIDPTPGGEAYPAWAWQDGERTASQFSVPLAGIPSGEYAVRVGLYDAITFLRLPARDGDGNPLPDDAASLGAVNIE